MSDRILYTKPSITSLEHRYAADAAVNGWGERCYEYITRFEKMFARYVGTRFAIATSSCTGALHLGMAALDIGPGDEVILAETNWVATVSPIVHLGATPVFVDVLPDSWCLDPQQVNLAITSRTRAIIATHIYGNLCEMDPLREIAKRHNIALIEDAAEAIGSQWFHQYAGSMGVFGAFSFHGTKTVTTGEGGMFVCNEESLYERVLTLNNHGRSRAQTKQFWPDMIGYKYKMSNVQAAMGCAQLERVESLVARKREILQYYKNALSDIPSIALNPEPVGCVNGAWMPTAVFESDSKITREQLQSAFAAANIDARVFFWPLSSLPPFTAQPQHHNAYSIPERAINLPSYHDMTQHDLDRVVAVLRGVRRD